MAVFGPRLTQLMTALRRLPGVGPKSAQRMAFQLLGRDRAAAETLRDALTAALETVQRCPTCRMFCENDDCAYCSPRRADSDQICVVESPADLAAIEAGTAYRGRYFVLLGRLSPLDGVGPEQLGLEALEGVLAGGGLREMILALNPSVEGEATAHYLARMAEAHGISVSRIAQGVPMGGELEYVDGGTLAHALSGRRPL